MKIFLLMWSLLLTLLCGCSHPQPHQDLKIETQKLNIISFQTEFQKFWLAAKGKTFEKQVELWDSIIETPHKEFYNSFVWSAQSSPADKERRLKRLQAAFFSYEKNDKKIQENFRNFEMTVYSQIEKFHILFPKAHFAMEIVSALSPTFNGKTASLPSKPDSPILAFGIDMITERNDNPDVLYSHELFHIYHGQTIGIKDDGVIASKPLTMPLWAEGMASYASHELNPTASSSDILMDKKLADLPASNISSLAKEFLKVSDEIIPDGKISTSYKNWFMMTYSFDSRFPSRCGYLLGYKVVEQLRKLYTLEEMTHWNPNHAHEMIKKTLREIRAGQDNHAK
jgi:hypothetical protein